jgi:hypothetical protein
MSLHKITKVTLTHLKGCEGCCKSCQWRSLVAVGEGSKQKFSCNTVVGS